MMSLIKRLLGAGPADYRKLYTRPPGPAIRSLSMAHSPFLFLCHSSAKTTAGTGNQLMIYSSSATSKKLITKYPRIEW